MRFTVRTVDVHLAVPFAISRAVRTEKRVVLVELDDGGRISYGEASADPFFGETSESLEADVRGAFDCVPEDPRDLATLRARLDARFPHGGAAACALDVLGHDRAAQEAGQPLRTFLGLAPAEAPPTSFTIGIAEPALMAERATAAKAAGFSVLKVKLGHGDDVAILDGIRRVFDGAIRVEPQWGVDGRGSAGPDRADRAVRPRVRRAAGRARGPRGSSSRAGAQPAPDRRRRGGGAPR